MRVKTVIYQLEMVVFLSVKTIFSRKTLAWSIPNSNNHIIQEQMLWLDLGFQNFANHIKIYIGINDPRSKGILPRNVKQRGICVHIHENHYCVIWKKNRKDALQNGVDGIDKIFKMLKMKKKNEISLEQRIRWKLPEHETTDQLENVFLFALQTYNDQEFAESNAAGLYDLNCLRVKWDRDLISDEMVIEKENVTVFDESNEKNCHEQAWIHLKNYEADEKTWIHKSGDEIVSSYRLLLEAHNSSCFDSWIVLNSLVKEITELKIIKTGRGMISLSFRCCVKTVNTVEVFQYVKIRCSNYHTKGSLEKYGR